VEETDQFVAAAKPAMLYFSRRPIDPNAIDLKQQKRLRNFKAATYKSALTGVFTGLDDLRQTLIRDLLGVVRKLKPRRRRTSPTDKLDEAQKLTELIRLHRQHDIAPEQFDSYRDLLGLKPRSDKFIGDARNPVVGLFFDYGATVSASINRDKPDEGWVCMVEIVGDNYETKKFEVIGIAVNLQFDTAEAAVDHGKNLVDRFGVECIDVRTEEL
jgi:hypothetical protein